MLPLTGLTAACGNRLERKPEAEPVPCRVPVRPRSPLVPPGAMKVATVTGAPKLTPWLTDLRAMRAEGVHQNAYTEWSGPTATNAPWLPEAMSVPPLGPNVAPLSVERYRKMPLPAPKLRLIRYTLPLPAPAKLSTVIHSLSSLDPPGVPLTGAIQVAPLSSERNTWMVSTLKPRVAK